MAFQGAERDAVANDMLDFRWDLLLRADRFDCDEARRLGVDSATTQSVPDPEGRGVWEARKDETTGRIFYVNHTLKKTQWHPPTPAGGAAGAPDELPEGWERRSDPTPHTPLHSSPAAPLRWALQSTDIPEESAAVPGAGSEEEVDECPVCLGEQDTSLKLPCGHKLCSSCASSWLARNASCPLCRAPANLSECS